MGGRNQVSGRVSVPCWHATPVENAPWKPLIMLEWNNGKVIPTDRSKLVCNRCVIEIIDSCCCCLFHFLTFSDDIGGFAIGLFHISSFSLLGLRSKGSGAPRLVTLISEIGFILL